MITSTPTLTTELALKLGHIDRLTQYDGKPETVSTHTLSLAMVVAELAEIEGLPVHECVMMALAHDLPEAYAGDTPTLIPLTTAERRNKDAREAEAAEHIARTVPYWGNWIRRYEEGLTSGNPAARLVYWADKLMPDLLYAMDPKRARARTGLSRTRMRQLRRAKYEMFLSGCRYHSILEAYVEALLVG